MQIYGRESANGDFPCAKLKNAKKIGQKFFLSIMKQNKIALINILSPTFVPNLMTLAWKMSPGMPKEAGSLNGPSCPYLIKQNLHNRTRPRSRGYEYPCHISKLDSTRPKASEICLRPPLHIYFHKFSR